MMQTRFSFLQKLVNTNCCWWGGEMAKGAATEGRPYEKA